MSCYGVDGETGARPAEATKVLLGLEEVVYEEKLMDLVCSSWRRGVGVVQLLPSTICWVL